ncbi:MAG: carotenoid biosynthesis protein [Ferruginibacter sp.]
MQLQINRDTIATAIAVFFHSIGLIGILFFDGHFFVNATPFNLLLSLCLLIWTQRNINASFLVFILSVFGIGFLAEVVGVNTGILFGDYSYGKVLGIQWMNVPLLIGVNWIIIIYCCGISVHAMMMKFINRIAAESKKPPIALKALSVIIDGATLAVIFDWLMEPVAVKLGFWSWQGTEGIPVYNYICWLMVSILLLTIFHFLPFKKENKFAVNLLLIQAMFFLVLRTFFD